MVIKVFFDLIIRCLFSKPWPKLEPRVTLSVGRFSQEKIQDLGAFWANSVDLKHPGLTFAKDAGLEFESKEALRELERPGRRWPGNFKLTSEYNEAKGTGEALPEAGSKDATAGAPEWALEGREPDRVKVEPSLKNLSADSEKALKSFLLMSRVGGALRP